MYNLISANTESSRINKISTEDGLSSFLIKKAIISPTQSGIGSFDHKGITIYRESIETDAGIDVTIQDFNIIKNITIVKKKRLYLSGFWSTGFWHWIFEFLPKVIFAENIGFDGEYVIPKTNFSKESLILLGINENRITVKDIKTEIVEEVMIIPRLRESNIYTSILCNLKSKLETKIEKTQKNRRLYIKRHKKNRGIINEEDLHKTLSLYEFETWNPENTNLKNQIQTAMSANALVGPHGAGMSHALFCQKKSLIIELFSPKYINPCIFDAVKVNNHKYFMVPSECNYKNDEYPFGRNIVANTEYINHILNKYL